MNAYYAIISSAADLSTVTPVLGWATVEMAVQGQPPTPADNGQDETYQMTDSEAQEQADRYAGDGRRSYRLDLTDAQWRDRPTANPALSKGKIIQGPPPAIPLKEQAEAAMQQVQQQASMTSAMGETFGPQMQAYVRSLRAIISGTDTASTTLPTAPADPTT